MNSIENIECGLIGKMLTKNDLRQNKDILKISGIYKIINKINGKYYLGSSKIVYRRLNEHITYLIGNYHYNYHLQNAWNMYDEDNFYFIILNQVNSYLLFDAEQSYLNDINKEESYNKSFIANRPEMNVDTRLKLSRSHKGKKLSDETKEKLRKKMTGHKFPAEFGKKVSDRLKGKPRPIEFGKKLSLLTKGKHKGKLSWNYDNTIYTFVNNNGEKFIGTQYDFAEKYNLYKSNVNHLIKGTSNCKSVKGWRMN